MVTKINGIVETPRPEDLTCRAPVYEECIDPQDLLTLPYEEPETLASFPEDGEDAQDVAMEKVGQFSFDNLGPDLGGCNCLDVMKNKSKEHLFKIPSLFGGGDFPRLDLGVEGKIKEPELPYCGFVGGAILGGIGLFQELGVVGGMESSESNSEGLPFMGLGSEPVREAPVKDIFRIGGWFISIPFPISKKD
jgi:hypothetical protein